MDPAASPFGLFRASAGPDFDRDVLDEFDDIETEVTDELRLKPFEILSRRPREITIRLGNISTSSYKYPKFTEGADR